MQPVIAMGKDDATVEDTSNDDRNNEAGKSQEHTALLGVKREHIGNNVSFVSEGDSERAADLRRQERRRQMNTIHSRRKRERQKIEVEVLREQCAQYSALNLSIFHKNKRLEELLELAKQAIEQHEKLFGVQIPSYQQPYSNRQAYSFSGALQLNPIQPPPAQPQLNPVTLQAMQLLLMQVQQQQQPPPPQMPMVASLPNPAPPLSNQSDILQQQLQQLMLQQLLVSGMSPEQIVALFVPGERTQISERTTEDDSDTKPPPKQSQS